MNFTGRCAISDPKRVINGISVSLGDCIIPASLQGALDSVKDNPVVSAVTLFPQYAAKKLEAGMLVELRQNPNFRVKMEKQRLVIDLEMAAEQAKNASQLKSASGPLKLADITNAKVDDKNYSGKKVSMEFENAELRHVFRLLADISGENFVITEDVKGFVTIKLKDVPWEQALGIIVKNSNLAVDHVGNVIEIMPKVKKIERDKAERDYRMEETRQKLEDKTAKEVVEGMETRIIPLRFVTAEKMVESLRTVLSQGSANVSTNQGQSLGQGTANSSTSSSISRNFTTSITAEKNTNKIIVYDYVSKIDEIEKLVKELDQPERQVMIEARIVVATSEFTRDFGVQWGVHFKDGSASFLGINSFDSGFGGIVADAPTAGKSISSSGVNTGISFGTLASNIQLDMKLSAAAAASMVKVIATPKIVTLNNELAKIEQGQSTFVQTTDKLGTPSMTQVTATLKLEVTPNITSKDSLTLKIDASDDSFGSPPSGATSVAINKRTASSKLVLRDGETVVIGGIFREQDSGNDSGVPYLQDLPVFGNLFKSSSKANRREELLIFITPRILSII